MSALGCRRERRPASRCWRRHGGGGARGRGGDHGGSSPPGTTAEPPGRRPRSPLLSPLAAGPAGIALFFAYAHLAFPDRGLDDLCLQWLREALARRPPPLDWLRRCSPASSVWAGCFAILRAGSSRRARIRERRWRAPCCGLWPTTRTSGLPSSSPGCPDSASTSSSACHGERRPRRGRSRRSGNGGEGEEKGGAITWFSPPRECPCRTGRHFQTAITTWGSRTASLERSVFSPRHTAGAWPPAKPAAWRGRGELAPRPPLARRSTGNTFPGFTGPGIEPGAARWAWCYGDPGWPRSCGWPPAASAGNWEREALARGPARGPAQVEAAIEIVRCRPLPWRRGDQPTSSTVSSGPRGTRRSTRRRSSGWGGLSKCGGRARGREGSAAFLLSATTGQEILDGGSRLLTGAAGIGLALLAAISPVEPEWDRLLLLS